MTEQVLMTEAATNPTEGQATASTLMSEAPKASETQVAASEGQKQAPPTKADPVQKKGDETGKPTGAPEKYEFKGAEGREYDPKVLETYSEVARELNLPQETAQKVLDKLSSAMHQRQTQHMETVKTEWANNARADKEFGGDGLAQNLAIAKKALDTFGSPELRTLLNESGLGNHPELIRLMYRAGKAISEDRFVAGSQGVSVPAGPKNFNQLASALYSNQPN